jgi:hypothetical protein
MSCISDLMYNSITNAGSNKKTPVLSGVFLCLDYRIYQARVTLAA